MKGDYKRVLKGTDAMNDKVAKARERIEAMQKTRDIYFSGRAETIRGIQDPTLHKQAQERLTADQQQFATCWRRCARAAGRWSRSGNSWPTRSPTWAAT